MNYKYGFSTEKDSILRETRKLGFGDIINAIESGGLLGNKNNPNQKKYPGQKLFVVKVEGYIYGVPYVIDRKRQVFFLKTFYPSRKLTKIYDKK